jgi:2'-hydroxyisoflavone reductase
MDGKKLNILMIGGTRYMGKIMVEMLLERGDQVTVFSRGVSQPEWWDQVSHIQGDRNDQLDFRSKLGGKSFDAVVDTQAYQKEDVECTVNAIHGNVDRYLLLSTSSVYLEGMVDFRDHCPYDESVVDWNSLEYDYPPGADPYAVGKRHCEKWLDENSTVPYTIIRVPAVMGPDDPTKRMWWWVQRALDGGRLILPTDSLGAFRTLYSKDAAINLIRALDSDQTVNQTCFVGMPEIMTIERWAQLIWAGAGHECQISYVPRDVIRKYPGLNSYSPPLTRPAANIHDLSKAQSLFGISATPVKEWVQTTVDWYKDSYGGPDSEGYQFRNEELTVAAKWEEKYRQLLSEF